MELRQELILWVKYRKQPFDISKVTRNSLERENKLWYWIQPGDVELWMMGGNDRYLITTYDQDAFDDGDFIRFGNDKAKVRSWLKGNGYEIHNRIGFSECIFNVTDGLVEHPVIPKMTDYENHVWVGYEIRIRNEKEENGAENDNAPKIRIGF